jgi:benzoate-CoA ligase family protein
MQDHTVIAVPNVQSTGFRFARRFNVAVPFIDRHLKEGRGSRVAIRSAVEDVSYAELAERVARCGNALRRLGLPARARLLMVVKDCPEFFYLFWGAIKAGIVPVPLSTELRPDDYKYTIEDSRCAAVVYSSEFAGEIEDAVADANHRPRHVLSVEANGHPSIVAMMGEVSGNLTPAHASAEDDCFWLYSSGSTDRPKGVVHRHRDMVVTSQLYGVDVLGIRPDDICFSAAKLFFAYGLGNAMTFPLWVGGTAVLLPDRATPQSTFATIERFRPTLYFGLPTLYAAQIHAFGSSAPDLSSIRLCVSAGEALPVHIFQKWRELTGTVILEGVGSTEALHIYISNRVDDLQPGTSGRVVPGYVVKLLDDRGRPVQLGESGQLYIRGDSVAKCYFNNPKRTRQTMVDGWLNTGDTFVQNMDGFYVYCGRSDDMLKVSGTWCSPFEIEAVLNEHPGVLEAAVVGRADADGLIKPEAWLVLNQKRIDPGRIEREIVQHCKAKLVPHKYPRWFHFVSELPKTPTGKIQRFRLRTVAGETPRSHSPEGVVVT